MIPMCKHLGWEETLAPSFLFYSLYLFLVKSSKKDTSFSLRSNPIGYSREPIFSVYSRALCVLEITSRRIISSAFLRSVRGTLVPRFLHTSSIARHAMPFVTFGGIFQCSFSRILSGRLRLFRPNLIWTRLCRPFFVICPDI